MIKGGEKVSTEQSFSLGAYAFSWDFMQKPAENVALFFTKIKTGDIIAIARSHYGNILFADGEWKALHRSDPFRSEKPGIGSKGGRQRKDKDPLWGFPAGRGSLFREASKLDLEKTRAVPAAGAGESRRDKKRKNGASGLGEPFRGRKEKNKGKDNGAGRDLQPADGCDGGQDHGPEPKDPLGKLQRPGKRKFQLSPVLYAGGVAGLCGHPRAGAPQTDEPFPQILARSRAFLPGL